MPLQRRQLLGVSVRPSARDRAAAPAMATQEVLRDLAEATALAARRARVAALVGVVDDISVRALLSLTPQADADAVLRRLSKEIHQAAASAPKALPVVVAVGTTVDAVSDARRTLIEAAHVAKAALRYAGRPPVPPPRRRPPARPAAPAGRRRPGDRVRRA